MARDPNRLYKFYDELRRIHMESFPDIRYFQLITIIMNWLSTKNIDPWNYEEDEAIKIIKDFEKDIKRV